MRDALYEPETYSKTFRNSIGRPAPASQGPPPGANPQLWSWFKAVDTDNSGSLTVDELQRALVNGDWSPFNIETVRNIVNMFDTSKLQVQVFWGKVNVMCGFLTLAFFLSDNTGTIDFNEFAGLWKYIEDWKQCFQTFDVDGSGSIDRTEMKNALRTFGYNLSDNFINLLIQKYDKYGAFFCFIWQGERFFFFVSVDVSVVAIVGVRPAFRSPDFLTHCL